MLAGLLVLGLGCSATPELEPQELYITLSIDGRLRNFELYVPASYQAAAPAPLMVAFHGSPGSSLGMRVSTKLDDLAEQEGILIAYPNSLDDWAPGCACTQDDFRGVDDVDFMRKAVNKVSADFNIDPNRVYALGFSAGGWMAYRMGCSLSNTFAGIAAVASSMTPALVETCAPEQPVAFIQMIGTEDPAFPWVGAGTNAGGRLPIDSTVAVWANLNGCDAAPTREVAEPEDDLSVQRSVFNNCAAEVNLYAIQGGTHTWPMHANETIGAFFLRNGR